MKMKRSYWRASCCAILLCSAPGGLAAQPDASTGLEAAVNTHLMALEQAANDSIDAVTRKFEAQHFSAHLKGESTAAQRRKLLENIAAAARTAGGVMIDVRGAEYHLKMHGPDGLAVIFTVEESPPYAIRTISLASIDDPGSGVALSWQSVADEFEDLEAGGFSGVLYLARDGEVLLERAYGQSNRKLAVATTLNTIYGIGSTPIDFTVAGLFLLAQEGKLSLDDKVGQFLVTIPADKRTITLRHLISGQSGLPDFHDTDDDWDADLAWIDRDTAVARIVAQPLLFAPGQGRAHSHSAFGLVAAVIEIVSGQTYFEFIKQNLFVPAGMTRTGMYGDARSFTLADFAVGYGPSNVGIPNIPPNWGPTSWLVMGSGGMYSTLGDMLRFYRFVRSPRVLESEYAARYRGATLGMGGSERGYFLFHASNGRGNEALLIINGEGRSPQIQGLSRGLGDLIGSLPQDVVE